MARLLVVLGIVRGVRLAAADIAAGQADAQVVGEPAGLATVSVGLPSLLHTGAVGARRPWQVLPGLCHRLPPH
ncbi:MAG TPA: hypothetical protein VNB49_12930 [Candidatus Dormibacteraeota bacterium]|nr:hypothetical protein [Candidatus Dormibacteraeota bacterium]